MSNKLYFTEKPTIVGTLSDITKTYGENIPDNNMDYEIVYLDGSTQTFVNAGLTIAQISRINDIQILNNADALANAGIWPYYVDPNDWLNPLYIAPDPVVSQTPLEIELLANYNFSFDIGILDIIKLNLKIKPNNVNITYGEPIPPMSYNFWYDSINMTQVNDQIIEIELDTAYRGDILDDVTVILDDATFMSNGAGGLVPNSYFLSEDAYTSLNGQALAMVNGKALAMVNGQALAMVNGQALAMVNGQALAMVNGQALAMVNVGALVNGLALAMVNTDPDGQTNGLALAMVNTQALAMVNNPDPTWSDPIFLNGLALGMVNTELLTNGLALAMVNNGGGLVNGQALAMVNSTSFNEITNEEAIIILTVNDVLTMMDPAATSPIELISVNTVSGNTATTPPDSHKIAPGAFVASNFNVEYQLGEMTVAPTPVSFDFMASSLDQDYGTSSIVCIEEINYYSSNTPILSNEGYDIEYYINGVWTITAPTNASTYDVRVSIIDPNYTIIPNTSTTQLLIRPADIVVTPTNSSKTYGDTDPDFTYTYTPELYYDDYFDGSLDRAPGTDVGFYDITLGTLLAGSNGGMNYNLTVLPGRTLEIDPAELIATAVNKVINVDDPTPSYSFSFIGFIDGENATSVFPDGPAYTTGYTAGSSGPGEYIIEITDPMNYIINIYPDVIYLFVNPDGSGTKAVVPKLDCVTDDGNGLYTAYFEYDNNNDVPVWVLIGSDNLVTGGGTPDISDQPIKFESGGGTWIATFDGSPMTWKVSSQDHGHKASHAQNASSNSRNCNKSAEIEPPGNADDELTRIYPNPVSGKLTVSMGESNIIRGVSLFNLVGKKAIVSEHRISDQMLEIDMTGLTPGVYLVRVQLITTTEFYRVIKQ